MEATADGGRDMDAQIEMHERYGYTDNFQLFSSPPVDLGREWVQNVDFHPLAPLTRTAPIQFAIMNNPNLYIDLKNIRLLLKVKITAAGGVALGEDAKAGFVQYPIASLFSGVDFALNQQQIGGCINHYAYRAMMDILLFADKEDQLGEYAMGLFIKDTAGGMDTLDFSAAAATADTSTVGNAGLIARTAYTALSKVVALEGRLHVDLCSQRRYLINGVPLAIKLWQNTEAFRIMSEAEAPTFEVHIEEAVLRVPMVKPSAAMILAHDDALNVSPALYPVMKSDLKSFNIPAGANHHLLDNVYNGEVPSRLIIGLVPSANFIGAGNKNPYNFVHAKLSYLSFMVNGRSIPHRPIQPDYAGDQFIDAYSTLFTLVPEESERKTSIRRNEYSRGYTLYAFNVDSHFPHDDHQTPAPAGQTRIVINFAAGLAEAVTVILYASFRRTVAIDRARNVYFK